jgi:hypothetical protein
MTGLDATAQDAVGKMITLLRSGDDVSPHVLLGPVSWQPTGPDGERQWYFIGISGDRGGARIDKLAISGEQALTEEMRSALFMALVEERPLVIHDFGDELELARMMETIWPSAQATEIRTAIEGERSGIRH